MYESGSRIDATARRQSILQASREITSMVSVRARRPGMRRV
jgi:hypothetical protein